MVTSDPIEDARTQNIRIIQIHKGNLHTKVHVHKGNCLKGLITKECHRSYLYALPSLVSGNMCILYKGTMSDSRHRPSNRVILFENKSFRGFLVTEIVPLLSRVVMEIPKFSDVPLVDLIEVHHILRGINGSWIAEGQGTVTYRTPEWSPETIPRCELVFFFKNTNGELT